MKRNARAPKGNYLVAGSTGLMGTTALLRLRDRDGIAVRATVHHKKPFVEGSNISYIRADLTKREDCERIVRDIDYVLMFAGVLSTAPVLAKDPLSHITGNMVMNSRMLEAAFSAGVKKFLWLSSTTGYPESEKRLKEADMFTGDPPGGYFYTGWMTRYTETLCRMYSTKMPRKMAAVVLRPSTIYGEYEGFDLERCHFLPALVRKVVDRQNPLEVWGTGKTRRDLVYCDDVFDACLLGLEKINVFNVFNIGSGAATSVNDILDMILAADSYRDAKIIHAPSRSSSPKERIIDTAKAERLLGFRAKTRLKEGVAKLVKFYRSHGPHPAARAKW